VSKCKFSYNPHISQFVIFLQNTNCSFANLHFTFVLEVFHLKHENVDDTINQCIAWLVTSESCMCVSIVVLRIGILPVNLLNFQETISCNWCQTKYTMFYLLKRSGIFKTYVVSWYETASLNTQNTASSIAQW